MPSIFERITVGINCEQCGRESRVLLKHLLSKSGHPLYCEHCGRQELVALADVEMAIQEISG